MALKGGNLFINRIMISPERVNPGEQVTIQVEVGNGALGIGPSDPDGCSHEANNCDDPGPLQTRGYCAGVSFSSQGRLVSQQTGCVHIALTGIGKKVFTERITAPSGSGQYTIGITLSGDGSGESESRTERFTVVEQDGGNGGGGGPSGCQGDADCPDGFVCHNGNCVKAVAGVPQRQALIAGGGIAVGVGLLVLGGRRNNS